jgi:hypothetical protein
MEVDKEAVDSSAGIFCLLDRRLDEVGLGGLLSLAALRFRAGVAESACAGESSACAESGAEAELGGFCAAWLAAWRAEDLVILVRPGDAAAGAANEAGEAGDAIDGDEASRTSLSAVDIRSAMPGLRHQGEATWMGSAAGIYVRQKGLWRQQVSGSAWGRRSRYIACSSPGERRA